MDKVFILAVIITVLFAMTKFIEIKYLNDRRPLKEVVRDSLIVSVCSLTGSFVYFHFQNSITDFFNTVTETKVLSNATTHIFTGNPEF